MGNAGGIAVAQVPVVVNEAVREKDVTDALAVGVVPRLFLAFERVNTLALRFDDSNGPPLHVQEQIINEPVGRLLEIVTEIGRWPKDCPRGAVLADDVVGPAFFGEKPPP